MNTTIRKFTYFLTACLLGCLTGHAYEQDNWYLHGPIDGNLSGVFHQEYNATAKKDMLYRNVTGVGLEVRDINGTLLRTINTGGITFTDIEYDQNTSRLFGINASKLTCFEQNSSGGWSEQWRSTQSVNLVVQGPSGKLFCSNASSKIYTFEQNGTMSEFGWVDGINSMSSSYVVGFAPSGTLVINAVHVESGGSSKRRIFYFDENGDYINSIYSSQHDDAIQHIVMSPSGWVSFKGDYSDNYWKLYHPNGASLTHPKINISLWLQNGDFISGSNLYRRTFRTKMETNHNSVPQPVIHRIAQRTGTNVMELDFEVIDTDDDNVTVGILAYCGSDKLVPQAWFNGTGSKIGTPIATNTVHSMEWDVKQDWNTSTGAIKFEILCQDGSRDKPVDLHFLKLPFADGNMTISRSPLKEADFTNYGKFLLATGQAQFESNTSNAVILPAEANTTEVFTFTNCGATGRSGPSEAQIQAEYNGTNLQGSVTTGWKAGYQEWTVPATGDYWIEAVGAAGGFVSGVSGGNGAFMRGKFTLSAGYKLNIVVGQMGAGTTHDSWYSSAGGGGTFVIADTNNTPLVIAGGGGGANRYGISNNHASISTAGGSSSLYSGGINGEGSTGDSGGGGFLSNGGSQGGTSYQNGAMGGDFSYYDGGFGGGGAANYAGNTNPGGGGGYSGGGGLNNSSTRSASRNAGGGGSYNVGTNQKNLVGVGGGDGLVRIYSAEGITPTMPKIILLDSRWYYSGMVYKLIEKLGANYRAATPKEVTKAREAATPGGVINWTATNQVKPRNLPGSVNEYGFDVSTTSGIWVIKE